MKKYILLLFVFTVSGLVYGQENKGLDAVGELSDGLVAIKKDAKWGFIDTRNKLIVDFRNDIVAENYTNDAKKESPVFKDNRSLIMELRDGIPYYGYIDRSGTTVIEPQFLNATNFNNGRALASVVNKTVKGRNEYLDMDIIQYDFFEAVIDTDGKVLKFLKELPHILMDSKKYIKPASDTRFVSEKQLAVKADDGKWEVVSLN